MKTEKDYMKALTEHNRFIRTVICRILNYSILALISIVCFSIGIPNLNTRGSDVGEVFTFIGGGIALVLVFLIFRGIGDANKTHQKITEYESNAVGTITQSKNKKEEKNKNGIIW